MRNQFALITAACVLANCTSPGAFIQATSQTLTSITSQITTYEDFKTTIRTDATYARLAYVDSVQGGYRNNIPLITNTANVCLRYSIAPDVQNADIQKRLADMKNLLASATDLLCSGTAATPMASGVVRVSAATTPDAAATGGGSPTGAGSICPPSKSTTPAQKARALYDSFAAVAQLTPASVYVTAATSIVQTVSDVAQLIQQNAYYRQALAFLANPKTQRGFKFAVERLESDLKNANDDLESNMRTFTTCQKARMDLADASLAWNDGTARLVFSREAVDRQKEIDAVQEKYNSFKKSFISDTTKSLGQLEDAFQKLPTLDVDPSALDGIVKDLGTVQTNLTKLNGAPATPPKPKGTTTASSSLIQLALRGRIIARQASNDPEAASRVIKQGNADQAEKQTPRSDLQTGQEKQKSL